MATQQEQLEDAQRQAELTRKQIEEQKRLLEENRKSITEPRKRAAFTPRGTREAQRRYLQEDIPRYRQQLSGAEVNLSEYESQISSFKRQLERQRQYDEADRMAEKYARTGDATIRVAATYKFGKDVYQYFNKAIKYYQGLSAKPQTVNEVSIPTEITPIRDSFGNIIGYSDPFAGQSRLPTPTERLFGRPENPIQVGDTYLSQPPKYDYPESIPQIEQAQKTNFLQNTRNKLAQLPGIAKNQLDYISKGLYRAAIESSLAGNKQFNPLGNPAYKLPVIGNIRARRDLIKNDKALESFTGSTYKQAREAELILISASLPSLSVTTKLALAFNAKGIVSLTDPSIPNKTKAATLKRIAVSLGTAALTSAGLGVGAKFAEDTLTKTGYSILARVLKNSGSTGGRVIRNIVGLSLVGTGKAAQAAVDTYFKTTLIGTGVEGVKALKGKDYERSSLLGAELLGGAIGYFPGKRIGTKVSDLSSFITGRGIRARPELFEGRTTVKRQPSAIQTDILTGKEDIIAYRRGPVEVGLEVKPRLDKYLSTSIKNPTEGVFFRFEETLGVKGNPIQPALSVPSFVQPPRYNDLFLSNLRTAKGNAFKRLVDAFSRTPILTDVLSVGRTATRKIPDSLREKIIREFATTGKLSKATQQELLKTNSLISDKLREYEFAEEQELVFRNLVKYDKNIKLGFTRDNTGRIIPVIYEKGTLKPRLSILKAKKIITEQDAKYVQRQYDMWKKFGEDYVLPKEHSLVHAKAVSKNVRRLVLAYKEFHPYLIKKYGSIEKAIKQLELGAKFHDIGKVSESSAEFGTPHGKKIYNIYKAGLLPKEAQNIQKGIAKAIKTHETLDPRKYSYQLSNLVGNISPEQKIISTADRLDLMRYGIKIDSTRLPLRDALTRLKITNMGSNANLIIKNKLEELKRVKNIERYISRFIIRGPEAVKKSQYKESQEIINLVYQKYGRIERKQIRYNDSYKKSQYNGSKYKNDNYLTTTKYNAPKYPTKIKYSANYLPNY